MKHRGMKLRLLTVAIGVGALALAAVAWAAPVTIPGPDNFQQNLVLNSAGDSFFDVYQPPDQYNDDCALGDLGGDIEDDVGFSPGSDVEFDSGANDTFDGGLVLWVEDRPFEDTDHTGDKVGEQITVGPTKLEGLRVKRAETALQGSPTLRSLIKLKNKKKKAVKRELIWDSDLGADNSEVAWASSSGDEALSNSDRWLVFADDDANPSDSVGTFVLYGKGKGVKKTQVFNPVTDQDSCISFSIDVRVPKKSSRYLLFFTEVHDTGADGADDAASDAAKFNKKKPAGELLAGLKKSVKKKVLNWDLVKEPKKK
jgi:hypothetical protein